MSYNQGERRPSWFNIRRLPPGPEEFDEAAISQSVAAIENIILGQVHAGIDSRRIILVGFSQGAALSMMVSLTTLHELGGVVSLSGWIPARVRGVSLEAFISCNSLIDQHSTAHDTHCCPWTARLVVSWDE